MSNSERIYLDYAASTPVDERVLAAMNPYWREQFGNAGSLHSEGRAARATIEAAREKIARVLQVKTDEITFTSGGTESNNLALYGTIEGLYEGGRAYESMHIITSAIEHSSVLDCFLHLEKKGVSVSYAPVTEEGLLDIPAFTSLLRPETVLVSLVLVSNEIGTVQPIAEVTRVVRAYEQTNNTQIYVHVDGSQGLVYVPAALPVLGADLLSVCGQKLYGPKGSGVLAHKGRVPLRPIMHGGTQERGLRPGTPVLPLVVGIAEAISLTESERDMLVPKVTALRDRFIAGIESKIPNAVLNGSRTKRIATNANFSFPGHAGEMIVIALDERGISASTRSACLAGVAPGSHVVRALNRGGDSATSAVRFTLGKYTTEAEIDRALEIMVEALTSLPLQ